MPDRSVVTRFEAKVDGYLGGVAKMAGATEKFAKSAATSATKHKADWDKIGKAAVVGGLAVGAVVVGAAKAYADFEKSMSGVAAVADANASQLKQLGQAAREAGKDTVFSATEAANAEAELAKAGVSVSDIMGGALRGSLDLAAAGQIDLAQSAEISAQAMNIFNKSGSEVGHIADVLTAGANKSAAGVDDLGMALQQGGLVAKQTGLSLEDTVGVLAAFADNALKGSDAGTSLKTMLQRLNPQSVEAATLMDELGLRAYDAQGNFVGLAKYSGMLQAALKDKTAEERNSALATLFGSDAVRGANVLYEQGEAGIRQYISAVDDQGAAQRMAARQTDNLTGDVEKLKGALQDALIGGGEGQNAGIRMLVQDITDLIDKWGELDPTVQKNIVRAAAVTSAVLLVGGGLINATTSVLAFNKALEAAGVTSTVTGAKMTGLAAVAARVALSIAAVANADALFGNSKASVSVSQLAKELQTADSAVRSVNSAFAESADFAQRADSGVRDLGSAFKASFDPSTAQQVDKTLGSIKGFFSGTDYSDIATANERLGELDQTLAKLASTGHVEEAKTAFADISREAARQGVSVKELEAKFPGYLEALDAATIASQQASAAGIQLSNTEKGAAKTAEQAAAATKEWADELNGLNSPLLDARAAARAFEESIDNASASIKENGRTLDIHTAKGRANQDALDGVAKAAINQITALQANGASQGKLQGTLETSRKRLIATYLQFDNNRARAKAYADAVLKIPASKQTVASFRVSGLSDLQAAGNYLKNLHDKKVTLTVGTVKVGNTKVNAGQYADGGPAIGPGTATSDSIPALLSNGEHVLTASEVAKAGGHEAIYRMRRGIDSGALRFAEGGAVGGFRAKFADGGDVDFSRIMSLVGDVTTYSDVASSRTSAAAKARAVVAARNALASLIAQQRKAARDLASARKSGDRDRVSDILDRQRLLLGRVAAAEGKLTAARTASAAAARKTLAVEKEYRADRGSLLNRTLKASNSTNVVSAAFLKNIQKLMSLGYGSLALQLMDMGGPEAEKLAAQAAAYPNTAKLLAKSFAAGASLSAQAAALRATLSGELPELSAASGGGIYQEVRDLSGVLRAPTGSSAPIIVTNEIHIDGLVTDPVGAGAALEKVLVAYQDVTGNPLKITTGP